MDNNLEIFRNEEFGEIRTAIIDNEPYFVGKDVAELLGYSNPQKAIRDHVDNEDKTLNELFTVNGTMGILINENDIYEQGENTRDFSREMNRRMENIHMVIIMEVTHGRGYVYSIQYHIV